MKRLFRNTMLVFAAAALVSAGSASATTVQKFTMGDLAKRSASIVRAKVEGQYSRRDDINHEIYTYTTINVLEPVKGAASEKQITIRQLGGTVGNLTSYVPGMPTFRAGEEVVLFLSQRDRAGYPWVMGLQQGKYSVVTGDNGLKSVRNELSGLKLLAPNGTTNEGTTSRDLPLAEFLAGIRTNLNADGRIKVDTSHPTPIH
ncbi:MAG: hypothetical protein ACRENN_06035 [Candidatus Eiseniibacteriota bacterium]